MNTTFQFFARKNVLITLGALAVGVVIVMLVTSGHEAPKTVKVSRGVIREEVSIAGNTKPVEEVSLAFERAGRIIDASADVGDVVRKGETILSLDASELLAQKSEAEASLAAQNAKLDELVRGARPEDIQVKQTELAKATQDLSNDYASVLDIVQEAYNDTDIAIRKNIDAVFDDDGTNSVSLTFDTSDSQKEINALDARRSMESLLNSWKNKLDSSQGALSNAQNDILLQDGGEKLATIRTSLNTILDVVLVATGVSTSSLNSYKTDVTTARSAVNSALTSVNNQIQAIAAQKVTVQKIQDELTLKLSGTDPAQIAAQRASVLQAEANVARIKAQLSQTQLRSPIEGTITQQDAKKGEIIAANKVLVSIISAGNLELEANIPEIDVGRIASGNIVRITLDAFPGEEFSGTVFHIDPGETLVSGVVNYKIKIAFDAGGELSKIKSGLTANLYIETSRKENVLTLPQYAITEKNGSKSVRLMTGRTITETQITTGVRGADGMVEILSGVSEGDEVVVNGAGS